jgi:hypothetical protein
MKIKTSELTRAALDWVVATCEGWKPTEVNGVLMLKHYHPDSAHTPHCYVEDFGYSTDWSQGGPIIDREKITIRFWEGESDVDAYKWDTPSSTGPTPLVAAMRCYVASKLGEEVEIPDELCN